MSPAAKMAEGSDRKGGLVAVLATQVLNRLLGHQLGTCVTPLELRHKKDRLSSPVPVHLSPITTTWGHLHSLFGEGSPNVPLEKPCVHL